MLKRLLACCGAGAMLLIALPVVARAQAQAPAEQTVTGTVVDVTCNFLKGVSGEAHRQCGVVCANAGLPLAILGDDGKLYVPLGEDAGKASTVDLKRHVDHKVTVKGKVTSSHGANGIQIASLTM